ncbi:hypothetical protein [Pseudomonas sp. EMN2]|uniref:hypothetical protein n=1 Tax=Pseudomonas sp. EMN2 TaxID=2615212 RepID=UPI00129B4C4C|nr:hypothetical protein [Pseudomonas sp. EMN2]
MDTKGTPIVLQIAGLGIPVVVDTGGDTIGLRWSSDPSIPADSPAYLLRDIGEVRGFLIHGADRRFLNEQSMKLLRVEAPAGAISISRSEAERQGVSADNWDQVRAGIVVTGNGNNGPISEVLEWTGFRDEYEQGLHVLAAFDKAKNMSITSPTIVTHTECGDALHAAEFMTSFHKSVKPQLLNAHQVVTRLAGELQGINLETIEGIRAIRVLEQMRDALLEAHRQDNALRVELGLPEKELPSPAKRAPSAGAGEQQHAEPEVVHPEPAPEQAMFRGPSPG